jgi:hypothetical protein
MYISNIIEHKHQLLQHKVVQTSALDILLIIGIVVLVIIGIIILAFILKLIWEILEAIISIGMH